MNRLTLLCLLAALVLPATASAQLKLPSLDSETLDNLGDDPAVRVMRELETAGESIEGRLDRLTERSRFVLERLDQHQRGLAELERSVLEQRRALGALTSRERRKPLNQLRLQTINQILVQRRALDQQLTRIEEEWGNSLDELAEAVTAASRLALRVDTALAAMAEAATTREVDERTDAIELERSQLRIRQERIDEELSVLRAESADHRARLDLARTRLTERDRAAVEAMQAQGVLPEPVEVEQDPAALAAAAAAAAQSDELSEAEREQEALQDELERLRIQSLERSCELDRVKLTRLEAMQRREALLGPVLDWELRAWTDKGEALAQRESGGLLGKSRGLINAEAVSIALSHTQGLILAPQATMSSVMARVRPPRPPRPGVTGLLLWMALLGLGGMVLALRLQRRVAATEPRGRGEATALRGLYAALPVLPVTLVAGPLYLLGAVPKALLPLYWFSAWIPPVVAASVAVGLSIFPAQGTSNLSPNVARYARGVVRVGAGIASLIALGYTVLPLLDYPQEVQLLVRGVALGWLLVIWLALLVRKSELLGAIGAAGDDPDEGLIRAGIRRSFRVFSLGPAAVYLLYVSGYTNLAAFLIQGGLVTLCVLLLAPWLHQSLRDLASRLLGYPDGGGPFALEKEAARSAYRAAAPLILLGVGVVSALLVAAGWNSGQKLGSLPSLFWHPFYEIGGSRVSVGSLVLLAVTVTMTVVVGRQLNRLLNRHIYPVYDLDRGMRATMDTLAGYVVLALGVVISLDVVGLGIGFLTVFAGVVGIGIGFGSQTLASNFISGLILLFARPVAVDDVIEVSGVTGRVIRISAYATMVRTLDNLTVVIPNADVVGSSVVNWSVDDPKVRLHVTVGVAYGSDVKLVDRLLTQAANEEPRVLRKPAPQVRFDDFGDSALIFTLLPWTDDPDNRFQIASSIRRRVDQLFREHKVEIPFPQRDLHLRAGDSTLSVALQRGLEVLDDEGAVVLEADPDRQKAARKK